MPCNTLSLKIYSMLTSHFSFLMQLNWIEKIEVLFILCSVYSLIKYFIQIYPLCLINRKKTNGLIIHLKLWALYYSGHRNRHCMHTQVIVDCNDNIVYVHSGFMGHTNDAQAFALMEPIGPGNATSFPPNLRILADKIYASRYPLLKGLKKDQLRRKPAIFRPQCKKFNRILNSRRVRVENKIGDIKTYRVVEAKFRHRRKHMAGIVEVACSLI